MSWISYITGGMTVILAYAFYTVGMEDEEEELAVEENNVVVNDFSGRYVTLSCQTCRKLKRQKKLSRTCFSVRSANGMLI